MATNLDPKLVAQILGGSGVAGYTPWTGSTTWGWEGGEAGHDVPGARETLIYGPQSGGDFSVQSNDVWDAQGNYVGPSSGDGDGLSILKFIAAAAAMYGGASAMSGAGAGGAGASGAAEGAAAGGGAGGAGGGWADWAASEMAGASANPATAAQLNGWAAGSSIPGAAAGSVGAAGAAGAGGAGGAGATTGAGTSGWDTLAKAAGAVAGAYDSRDQTVASNRDPWGPAQPFLKDLLGQASTLSHQYQQQPFSAAQQTAYGNVGGLLNALNQGAPGLLAGFGANASGANNFDRANPRRALTGSSFQLPAGYSAGLLNFFGGGGK